MPDFSDIQSIREAIDSNRDRIIDWLKEAIRIPSENKPPGGQEFDFQRFISEECRDMGLDVFEYLPTDVEDIQSHPFWLDGRDYGNKRYNVDAVWEVKKDNVKSKSNDSRSILLSGHGDVAPREPGPWKVTKPFEPLLEAGKLYGRGSADMKGGIAASFWAIKILREMGFEPGGKIIFESVVDEEYAGGNGTLAGRLKGFNADLAVVAEPTGMEVCPACMGAFLGDLIVKGQSGMPYSGHEVLNPVYGIGKAIEMFRCFEKNWSTLQSHPLFVGEGKKLKVILYNLSSAEESDFIQMGIPSFAKMSWIVWCYPGMEEDKFYKSFYAIWDSCKEEELENFELHLKKTYHFVRPFETSLDEPAVEALCRAFRDYTECEPRIGGAPFSCDLAIYGEVGKMPAILLGPRGENLHGVDEYVLIDDVLTLTGIFATLIYQWCR